MRIEPWHEGMPDPHGLSVRHVEEEILSTGGKLVFNWCIVGGSYRFKIFQCYKKGRDDENGRRAAYWKSM